MSDFVVSDAITDLKQRFPLKELLTPLTNRHEAAPWALSASSAWRLAFAVACPVSGPGSQVSFSETRSSAS